MKRHLQVNEIFFSIQGESTHAGRPCLFVRLKGCPLRCTYCDTEYAFFEGQAKSFDDIFEEMQKLSSVNLVEVTGGEPLAQPETKEFINELFQKNYEVLIETSGAFSVEGLNPKTKIILDIKTPGSGESRRQLWDNLGLLKPGLDEVKFVVTSKTDFDYAVGVCTEKKLFEKVTCLVSPSWAKLSLKELSEWVLSSQKPFRLQTQLHKHIWGSEVRGV